MRPRMLVLTAVLIASLLAAGAVLAQSGGYALNWWTVDNGGVTFAAGGSYDLGATIGQPDAGTQSGGTYTLDGGFWPGVQTAPTIYLPTVLR